MKKLMIAAAIVCAAAFVQASTVAWTFGNIYSAGAGGTGWSEDGLTGDVQVQLILGTSMKDGVIGDTVYDAASTIAFDSGYAYPEMLTDVAMVGDVPYYSQIIITKGDSTLTSGIFELTAAKLNDNYAYPNWSLGGEVLGLDDATSGSLVGLGTIDETYGTFSASGWQTVPEPTSGLLLLLGVAGLALRRRRA